MGFLSGRSFVLVELQTTWPPPQWQLLGFARFREFTPQVASAKRTFGFSARGCDGSEAIRCACFIAAFQPAQTRTAATRRSGPQGAGQLARVQRRLSRGRPQVHAVSDSCRQARAGTGLRQRSSAGGAAAVLWGRRRFLEQGAG